MTYLLLLFVEFCWFTKVSENDCIVGELYNCIGLITVDILYGIDLPVFTVVSQIGQRYAQTVVLTTHEVIVTACYLA